jgi:hypothetical protein
MGSQGKSFASILILFVIMSCLTLLVVKPANAQSVAKLPVPEFTVKYTDHSYDTLASTSIDPFTGQTIENPPKHIEDRTLQFTIKNQAISSGNLHFIVSMKGHFSQNWTTIYDGWAGWSGNPNSSIPEPRFIVWQFSTLRPNDIPGAAGRFYLGGDSFYLPSEGQVDFQVKAQTWGEVMATTSPQNPFGGSITTLFGESDWSDEHTITLTDGAAAGSINTLSTPTPTPSVPELSWLVLVPLLLSALSVAVLLRHRKTNRGPMTNQKYL